MKTFREFYLTEKAEDTFTVYKGDFLSSSKNNSLARSYMSKISDENIEALKDGLSQLKLGNEEGIQSRFKNLDSSQKEAVVAYLITKYRAENVESDSEIESGGISSKYRTNEAKKYLAKIEKSLKGLPEVSTSFSLDTVKEPIVKSLKSSKIEKEDTEEKDTEDKSAKEKGTEAKKEPEEKQDKGEDEDEDEDEGEDEPKEKESGGNKPTGFEGKASEAIKEIDNKISEINSEMEKRVNLLRVGKRRQIKNDIKQLKQSKEFIKTYSRTAKTTEMKNAVENNISNAINLANSILKDVQSVKTEGEKAEFKTEQKSRKEEAKTKREENAEEEKEKRKLIKKGATKYDLQKQKKEEGQLKKKGKYEANIINRADNLSKTAERYNIDNSSLAKAVSDRNIEDIEREEQIIRNKIKQAKGEMAKETASKAGEKVKETASKVGEKVKETASKAGESIKSGAQETGERIRTAAQRAGTGIRRVIDTEKKKEDAAKNSLSRAVAITSQPYQQQALERLAQQKYGKKYNQLSQEQKKEITRT